MIRFVLNHVAELLGGVCLSWALFSLGRLWERDHPEAAYVRRVLTGREKPPPWDPNTDEFWRAMNKDRAAHGQPEFIPEDWGISTRRGIYDFEQES